VELLTAGREYGWLAVLFVFLVGNAGRIGRWLERVIGKVLPTWAEGRRLKAEREQAREREREAWEREREREREAWQREREAWEREQQERARLDVVVALKETLIANRDAMDAANRERQALQERLILLVERAERRDAQLVEALRDVSEAIRGQSARIDRLEGRRGE
jgi:hypothetical protein